MTYLEYLKKARKAEQDALIEKNEQKIKALTEQIRALKVKHDEIESKAFVGLKQGEKTLEQILSSLGLFGSGYGEIRKAGLKDKFLGTKGENEAQREASVNKILSDISAANQKMKSDLEAAALKHDKKLMDYQIKLEKQTEKQKGKQGGEKLFSGVTPEALAIGRQISKRLDDAERQEKSFEMLNILDNSYPDKTALDELVKQLIRNGTLTRKEYVLWQKSKGVNDDD